MNLSTQKQQAWALYNEKKVGNALQICEEICDDNQADAETYYLLGNCHGRLRQFADAIDAFQNSLRIKPDEPQSLLALANAFTRLGRLEEAVEIYRSVLVIEPKMARVHCSLANLLRTLKLTNDAQEHYELARDLQPELGAPYVGLGILAGNSDQEKALAYFQTAVKLEPGNPAYQCSLGEAYTDKRSYEKAYASFNEALRLTPEFPVALGGIALLHGLEGEYDKSMEIIELLKGKNIYNSSAAIAFTMICKHRGQCNEAVKYAEKALEFRKLGIRGYGSLHSHIARALDAMGRFDEAWQHCATGNKALEQLYETATNKLRKDKMIEVFSPVRLMSMPRSTVDSMRPVFIVGMPRSGTSLVEQILAAHPSVCGGGELTYISDLRRALPREISSDKPWPDCVCDITQDDLNRLARRYLDQLAVISKSAERVTDKMPQNFHELGLIQMLFPRAKVIHCKRDPMDTCLSIFFQNFLEGHDYARNPYHIGTYYHQYQRLMDHWQHSLSIPILDVQYEELVRNPEPAMKHMLEHCNLEWDESCLDFHKSKRRVNTASFDQVRQPMYTQSIGRSQHYESHLGDLKKGLERGF